MYFRSITIVMGHIIMQYIFFIYNMNIFIYNIYNLYIIAYIYMDILLNSSLFCAMKGNVLP